MGISKHDWRTTRLSLVLAEYNINKGMSFLCCGLCRELLQSVTGPVQRSQTWPWLLPKLIRVECIWVLSLLLVSASCVSLVDIGLPLLCDDGCGFHQTFTASILVFSKVSTLLSMVLFLVVSTENVRLDMLFTSGMWRIVGNHLKIKFYLLFSRDILRIIFLEQ